MQTIARKRLEILADAPLVPRIVGVLAKAGIHNHNVLPVLSGSDHHGSWSEERLTGAESKQLVVAIAGAESADSILDLLGPLLESHGLTVTLSDVQVIRGERF